MFILLFLIFVLFIFSFILIAFTSGDVVSSYSYSDSLLDKANIMYTFSGNNKSLSLKCKPIFDVGEGDDLLFLAFPYNCSFGYFSDKERKNFNIIPNFEGNVSFCSLKGSCDTFNITNSSFLFSPKKEYDYFNLYLEDNSSVIYDSKKKFFVNFISRKEFYEYKKDFAVYFYFSLVALFFIISKLLSWFKNKK